MFQNATSRPSTAFERLSRSVENMSGAVSAAIAWHRVYWATLEELQRLDARQMDELGLHKNEFKTIARKAADSAMIG